MTNSFARTLIYLSILATLGACATSPVPPPVVEAGEPPPIQRDPAPEAQPPRADPSKATGTLLAAADKAALKRDHATEIAYLERAVRLDARNPALWLRLSQAHLADNNFVAATQHARKAIALSNQNIDLRRSAWLHMADIKQAQGQEAEAQAIRAQYGSVRG